MRSRTSWHVRLLILRTIGFVIVGECIALSAWRATHSPRQSETKRPQNAKAAPIEVVATRNALSAGRRATALRSTYINATSEDCWTDSRGNIGGHTASAPAASGEPMDPLSKQLFGSRDVTFSYDAGQKSRCQTFEKGLFGRRLTQLEYTELVAAPSGSTIRVRADLLTQKIRILVNNPFYEGTQFRSLFKRSGKLEMENDGWIVRDDAPAGLATRVIGRQVYMAHRIGVRQIGVYAGGSYGDPHLNGYYTWPRLGFNVRLNAYKKQLEADGFHNVTDTNDLFGRPGGAEWWKRNGKDCYGVFDVDPKSVSSIVLKRYLKAKGAVPYEEAG